MSEDQCWRGEFLRLRSAGEADERDKPTTVENGDAGQTLTPVRLCCGQRHFGSVCPDGMVMCCLCFERVSQDKLNVASNGKKEDVCNECAESEREFNTP